jgi:uncharacterized alkaline shock family protein YloU
MNEENKIGNVKIADDVVSVIARIAADEIDGITGMTTSFTSGFKDIVSGKTASKGMTGLNVVSVNIFVQSVSFVVEESLEAK